MTFDEISRKADQAFGGDVFGKSLGARVAHEIDSARINADDTVYADKTEPAEAWNRVAVSSLEVNLSCLKDEQVADWFRLIGFVW